MPGQLTHVVVDKQIRAPVAVKVAHPFDSRDECCVRGPSGGWVVGDQDLSGMGVFVDQPKLVVRDVPRGVGPGSLHPVAAAVERRLLALPWMQVRRPEARCHGSCPQGAQASDAKERVLWP